MRKLSVGRFVCDQHDGEPRYDNGKGWNECPRCKADQEAVGRLADKKSA